MNYSLDLIPQWCEMSFKNHFDGMGGCWGIHHGEVAKKGEEHCFSCEFHHVNRDKTIWPTYASFISGQIVGSK